MVDIEKLFPHRFGYTGGFTVRDGVIDASLDVIMDQDPVVSKIPLEFGTVGRNFNCDNNRLTSLENSPHTVGGTFRCKNNRLKSLEGGPKTVGRDYICNQNPLTSLKGIAESIGGIIYLDYSPELPLLRVLIAGHGVKFANTDTLPDYVRLIENVLRKFSGQGKRGVLACTKELLTLEKELQKNHPDVDLRGNIKW